MSGTVDCKPSIFDDVFFPILNDWNSMKNVLDMLLYVWEYRQLSSHLDILKDTIKPYTADDSGHLKTMVVFDCRGVEPIEFSPRVNVYSFFYGSTYINYC